MTAESDVAFEIAIRAGRLSADKSAPNYAGHYMYMGTARDGVSDAFKHRMTREYIPLLGAYPSRWEK